MSRRLSEIETDSDLPPSAQGAGTNTDQPRNAISMLEPFGGVLCAALSVLACSLFLPTQSLWIDEIDQLGGLTLTPFEVFRWLAGWSPQTFIVGTDCMPPASYWLGWLWSRFFGLGETQLRWLGVTCTALSTLLIFHTARANWGLASGFAAGLLFAISPNVIIMSVEIRAYPLYLLTSAATFWFFTRLLRSPGADATGCAIGLAVCSILDIYTHFFGMVLVGSCLLAALVVEAARGGRTGPIILAASLIAIASLGVMPPLLAAFEVRATKGITVHEVAAMKRVAELAKLLYRLFAAPSTQLSVAALAITVLGAAQASVASLAPKRRGHDPAVGLILCLAAGISVVFGASFFLKRIDALAPRYNLWMVSASLLLLSSGLAAKRKSLRTMARSGIALLVLASLYPTIALVVHGKSFAHNPHRQIQARIAQLGTEGVAVVHDASQWNYDLFISLRHALGPGLKQYLYSDGKVRELRIPAPPHKQVPIDFATLNPDFLVVLTSRPVKSWEIVDHLRAGSCPMKPGKLVGQLAASTKWMEVEQMVLVTFVSARMSVFSRVANKDRPAND